MLALLLLVQLRLSSRNRAAVLSHVGEDMNPPSVMQSIAHLFDADVPVEDDDDNHSYNAHHDHIDGDDDDDDHNGRGSCKVTWDTRHSKRAHLLIERTLFWATHDTNITLSLKKNAFTG